MCHLRRFVTGSALTFGLLIGSVACSTPGSQVVDGEGIIGTFTVNGTDALGTEYSGTVVIGPGDGDGYTVQWIVTGAIHQGVGRLDGERFEVEWRSVSGPSGTISGTASYVVEADGDLVGIRTTDGADGVAVEEIFQEA